MPNLRRMLPKKYCEYRVGTYLIKRGIKSCPSERSRLAAALSAYCPLPPPPGEEGRLVWMLWAKEKYRMRVSSVWAGNEATATKTVLFSDRFRIPSLIPRGISCGGSSDDSRYPYATLADSLTYHRYLSDKYQTLYQPSLTSYIRYHVVAITAIWPYGTWLY